MSGGLRCCLNPGLGGALRRLDVVEGGGARRLRDVEGVGSPVARRRRGWWGFACRGGLAEIAYIVNIFPGQAHRWLVDEGGGDCSTATRKRRGARRGWWRSSAGLGDWK